MARPSPRAPVSPSGWTLIAVALVVLAVAWWFGRPSPASVELKHAIETGLAGASVAPGDSMGAAVSKFYRRRGYRGAWSDGRYPNDKAVELAGILSRAAREGLDPTRYLPARLSKEIEALGVVRVSRVKDDASRLAALDLDLTYAFLTYARDLRLGRLPSARLDPDWVNARSPLDLVGSLNAALGFRGVARTLDHLAPDGAEYRKLRVALAHYRSIATGGDWPTIGAGATLKRGDRGAEVRRLRRRLELEGDADSTARAPGFDAGLEQAVRSFQRRHGLTPNGRVGAETRAALALTAAQRTRQIELNMEGRRWLPASFPEPYILVNLPDFTMEVRDSGRVALYSRAVVGDPRNPTPVFSAAVSYLVINPTWRLPKRILVEEIIPALHRDTTYLTRHHMRVSFTHAPIPVEVGHQSVDWSVVEDDTFPYLVYQDCGPENPLGRIEFMCPNEYDVYLHDTPQKALFEAMARAHSHGCVRIEKARALADWVLARDTLAGRPADAKVVAARRLDLRDSLDAVIDSMVTRSIGLKAKIPIHFMYWTAWVDSSGAVQFRDDLYGIDQRLDEALRKRRTASFEINPPLEWGEKHRALPVAASAAAARPGERVANLRRR